jgi:hypothetical protein
VPLLWDLIVRAVAYTAQPVEFEAGIDQSDVRQRLRKIAH